VTGRPSDYSDELAATICARLMAGESLRDICDDDDMPGRSTVYEWLAANSSFADRYARAREVQADTIFDEILTICDDARNDWMEKRDADGAVVGWQENGEAISRSRLRVDARKWMAGKLRPKVYGEKVTQEVTGPDGGALQVATIDPSRLSDAQLKAIAGIAITK